MSTEQLLRSHPSAPGRISSLLQELTQEVALITFCLRITFGPFHRVVGKMKVLFSSLDFTMSDDETLAGVVLPSLSPQDGLGTAHRSWHPQCGQVSALWRYCPGWVCNTVPAPLPWLRGTLLFIQGLSSLALCLGQ